MIINLTRNGIGFGYSNIIADYSNLVGTELATPAISLTITL